MRGQMFRRLFFVWPLAEDAIGPKNILVPMLWDGKREGPQRFFKHFETWDEVSGVAPRSTCLQAWGAVTKGGRQICERVHLVRRESVMKHCFDQKTGNGAGFSLPETTVADDFKNRMDSLTNLTCTQSQIFNCTSGGIVLESVYV